MIPGGFHCSQYNFNDSTFCFMVFHDSILVFIRAECQRREVRRWKHARLWPGGVDWWWLEYWHHDDGVDICKPISGSRWLDVRRLLAAEAWLSGPGGELPATPDTSTSYPPSFKSDGELPRCICMYLHVCNYVEYNTRTHQIQWNVMWLREAKERNLCKYISVFHGYRGNLQLFDILVIGIEYSIFLSF